MGGSGGSPGLALASCPGIVWRCLCSSTLSDLICHITADISGLVAFDAPYQPDPHLPLAMLHLTAKPLIETNFQYNQRTTNNMTDATKSYVVSPFFVPSSFAIRFVYLVPKSVTFYERSFVLPHCASAQLPNLAKHPFFHSFYLLYFLGFFLALSIRPNTPSSASTSCCFRNFMLLTNLSLSGLLFSQGVPWRETTTSLPHPSTRLHLMCLLLMIN